MGTFILHGRDWQTVECMREGAQARFAWHTVTRWLSTAGSQKASAASQFSMLRELGAVPSAHLASPLGKAVHLVSQGAGMHASVISAHQD